jgi:A/G-specific adenine glycosylase
MLLRQTRAESVAKIWNSLFLQYPNAREIAMASEEKLFENLKFLGFGKMRSRALILASQWLVKYHDGEVPPKLTSLLEIPHVGSYAAHAVLCFAFGEKIEIVDGNVQRFFSRYYNLEVKADIRRNPHIPIIARAALPREKKKAALHNYGLLDFTAQICKPVKPLCEICPLSKSCITGIKYLAELKGQKV